MKTIERDEVRRLLDEGAVLVDVLPSDEFEDEHIPGARSIPLGRLDRAAAESLRDASAVITVCNDAF